MTLRSDSSSARSDARAHQRWLIGVGITVAFGLFGAVMAVLAYNGSTRAPSRGPARSAPGLPAAAAPTPEKDGPAKPVETDKSDKPGKPDKPKDEDRN